LRLQRTALPAAPPALPGVTKPTYQFATRVVTLEAKKLYNASSEEASRMANVT